MNKTERETIDFLKNVEKEFNGKKLKATMGIAVPTINLKSALNNASVIKIAAQNIHHENNGAYTGETSVEMLVDLNVKYCIVGHSERRLSFGDSDEIVNKKVLKLLANKITPIFCLGETLEQYEAGFTKDVVYNQLAKGLNGVLENDIENIIIAYEPIWAIGTGKTATPEIAQNICKYIREKIESMFNSKIADKVIIQYGGSVNPNNIKEILAQNDINGALVGGASLVEDSFINLNNKI